jgi:hypothetical protein
MGRGTQRSARSKSNDAHPLSPAGDRTGMPCHACGVGVYAERDGFDDMAGLLHCTNCGAAIDRWVNESDLDMQEPGI